MTSLAQPPGQDRPSPVVAAQVVEKTISSGQTYVASITPLKTVVVGSAVDGRVIELLVEDGERVAAGQVVAKLLTETIELELKVAEAELSLRDAELDELKNGSLPQELEQAKARMDAANSNLEYAQSNFERIKSLVARNAVSQGDFDEARNSLISAEFIYYDLKAAYDLVVVGSRPERIAQAEARLATQAATVALIRDRIKRYEVRARFDGYVTQRFTQSGAWLRSGDPVVEMVALDQVEIRAFVAENHIPFVRPGMEVRVEIPAFPQKIFTGKVSAIIPLADTRARSFPVHVRVDNEVSADGPMLKAGMFARVEIPTGERTTSLMVPKDAIVLGGIQPVVFVVNNSANISQTRDQNQSTANSQASQASQASQTSRVSPVTVQLGVASGDLIAVRGELQKDQWVIVEGNERLQADQVVNITATREPPAESSPTPASTPASSPSPASQPSP